MKMEYKVFKIFEKEEFNKLMKGIKIAHCMGSSSIDTATKNIEEQNRHKPAEDLIISEKLCCSFCNTNFENQAQQRLHYKLDWHRYNLKQRLHGLKSVTEEKFTQLADDLSSISGSESESESEDGESSDSVPSSAAKLGSSRSSDSVQAKYYTDDNDFLPVDNTTTRHENLRLMASRHAKVFFENADGKILSLYRCLLHGKKDMPENDECLIPLALKSSENPFWAIIMLGGGHFAAGIFQGQDVLVHKTFHCYTVRARQGGSQSSRDNRTGGSHPKSAGASLRRYNEAALIQHVQDIMDSWSSQLGSCGLILYRAVGHNRNVLFSGRNPPLNKNDPRLRTIPFATRRATFSEVKRVHDILSSAEMYGSAESFKTVFPQSPRKRCSKFQSGADESISVNSVDPAIQVEDNEVTLGKSDIKKHMAGINSDSPCEHTNEGNEISPKRGSSKRNIDRAKPRKSPHRPFPGIVNAILARSSSESDMSETHVTLGGFMIDEDVEISFDNLQEFEDTIPPEMKGKKKFKDNKKGGKKQQKKQVEKDIYSAPVMDLRHKLWTACRLGDTDLLINSLQACQPIEEEPENPEKKENSPIQTKEDGVITMVEYLKCLNENVGESKDTLLHVAAQGGHMAIIRALMEAGCDPCVRNKKSQTPYVVSINKETRNIFRRFLADYPDKYDYSKAQISGPLTDEMEQKMTEKRREQRKAKREREKEKKKEEEVRKEEEAEKARFLQLSDREKRALAAERRLLSQASVSGVKPIVSRCFQCAVDITGKIPFEYDIHRFCSIDCLKFHRLKNKRVPLKC
ncbi:tRNA endonuclease ANKZF1-like [Periplaneta americana]|uniref:tRNA endonuclease ANKZF1-like n=1 Tax=Periplaneta americana TaxID=6978 RepID=UPI0037E80D04